MKTLALVCGLLAVGCQSTMERPAVPAPQVAASSADEFVSADRSRADALMTIEFEDADLRAIAEVITFQGRSVVEVDDGIEASVTFKIENAHWTEVLEAIAENAGCALVEIEGGYRFTRLQPCSKAYPGTPLRMAFEILAKDLELNLVIPASVSGEITRSLPAQPTLDSVVELAHRHGHRVVLGTDGDLEVFRIVPSEK